MSEQATTSQTAPTVLDATLGSATRWVVPCATLPLFVGGIAFASWLFCYWKFLPEYEIWFVMMGIGALIVGAIGLLVGGTVLVGRLWQARKLAGADDRRRLFIHTGFLTTLLILNIPLTFFMCTVVVGAYPATLICIDNQTPQTLSDITLVVGDERHDLGRALGNRVTRFRFRPPKAERRMIATWNDQEIQLAKFSSPPGQMIVAPRVWMIFKSPAEVESTVVNAFSGG